MEIVPRSAWQDPRYPVVGPRFPGWGQGLTRCNTMVVHYGGVYLTNGFVTDGRTDYDSWQAKLMRSADAKFRASTPTGYSFAYNWKIARDGVIWEGRGWDIQNAANSDKVSSNGNENMWSFSVHLDVNKLDATNSNKTEEVTEAQWAAACWLYTEAANRAGFAPRVMPHCDVIATGCPGDKAIAGIRAHRIHLVNATPPPLAPVPAPPDLEQEHEHMPSLAQKVNKKAVWLFIDRHTRVHVNSQATADVLQSKYGTIIPLDETADLNAWASIVVGNDPGDV